MIEHNYSRLDQAFARFMSARCDLQDEQQARFFALIRDLSAMQMAGHSCMPVTEDDAVLLGQSLLVSKDGKDTPFILDGNFLYSQRYWHYETRLARQLVALNQRQFPDNEAEKVCRRYFEVDDNIIDDQHQAALKAAAHAFTIIAGGPGTGKTTTVVKILAILQELNQNRLHIVLAAPTGKAAMRLQESINASKLTIPAADAILDNIPAQVFTLHHLLGAMPPTPRFKHDNANPLPYDLLVVDEASMVDLPLMSKLVDALKPGARLILLGDQDQLASVETGMVLQDLIRSLPDCTRILSKTHRFSGPIKALATAINNQQGDAAWRQLHAEQDSIDLLQGSALDFAIENYQPYWHLLKQQSDFSTLFAAFNQFRVLCSNRYGKDSVSEINYKIEKTLEHHQQDAFWYAGKPVMVTENNHAMQLFNGDIGLCLPDEQRGNPLSVFFQMPDGKIKRVLPGRMPACETAYAMTIHKSQGSEFDRLLILLPETFNPVLSKQLLYTAITRTKQRLTISSTEQIFKATVSQCIHRHTGLAKKIENLKKGN